MRAPAGTCGAGRDAVVRGGTEDRRDAVDARTTRLAGPRAGPFALCLAFFFVSLWMSTYERI